jgi:hypothetical protein
MNDSQARHDDYRRYLALWQASAVRELGPAGLALAIPGTIVLLAALLAVARPLSTGLRRG